MHQKTNHKLHHPIPLRITHKSYNVINYIARVPIIQFESPYHLRSLKQSKSNEINISLKQKKSKIITMNALLESVLAYIISNAVLLKTDLYNITTTTENIKTNIHNLMDTSRYDCSTPL